MVHLFAAVALAQDVKAAQSDSPGLILALPHPFSFSCFQLEKATTYQERAEIRAVLRKRRGSSTSSATSPSPASEAVHAPYLSAASRTDYKRPGFQSRTEPPASYGVRHWETLDVLGRNRGGDNSDGRGLASLDSPASPHSQAANGVSDKTTGVDLRMTAEPDEKPSTGNRLTSIDDVAPGGASGTRQRDDTEEAAIRRQVNT